MFYGWQFPEWQFPNAQWPNGYEGLRVWIADMAYELCLVIPAAAPAGMGGELRIRDQGVTLAVYLVAPDDPRASPVRITTTTGAKAIRLAG